MNTKAGDKTRERNLAIHHDVDAYQKGHVYMVDLVSKYRLSSTRLVQIWKAVQAKKEKHEA